MRKSLVFVALMLIAACASQRNNSPTPGEPEVSIDQLSSAPAAAQHVTGGMPVQYRLSLTNTAQFPITLKRIDVQSIGSGAYEVNPTSLPFDLIIQAGGTEAVDFWVPANATTSVAGANGAVALRLVTLYNSPSGAFQSVVVRQVMGRQ